MDPILNQGVQNTQFVQGRKRSLWQTSAVYDRIAKMLLESKPTTGMQVRQTVGNVDEALVAAVVAGNAGRVRALLAQGADPNATDRGRSALTWAAFWNHAEVAQILLGSGANPNLRDTNGFTALMWASERGYAQMAGLLQQQN